MDVLRGDFTRSLKHFYLGLKKDIKTVVRDIFTAKTLKKKIREWTPVETECMNTTNYLHAFLSKVSDLEAFMKKPSAVHLRYTIRRMYVLMKIERGVKNPFETRTKAWEHFKALLNDYAMMDIGDDDESSLGVSGRRQKLNIDKYEIGKDPVQTRGHQRGGKGKQDGGRTEQARKKTSNLPGTTESVQL